MCASVSTYLESSPSYSEELSPLPGHVHRPRYLHPGSSLDLLWDFRLPQRRTMKTCNPVDAPWNFVQFPLNYAAQHLVSSPVPDPEIRHFVMPSIGRSCCRLHSARWPQNRSRPLPSPIFSTSVRRQTAHVDDTADSRSTRGRDTTLPARWQTADSDLISRRGSKCSG